MRLLQHPEPLGAPGGRVSLALGFFDGVHLGHREIIERTLRTARKRNDASVVVTFDRHPSTVVAPGRIPPLIYPLEKKVRTLESLNPDALLLLGFTPELSRQSAEQFIEWLSNRFGGLSSICVGSHFVFGHTRGGNVTLLDQLGRRLGFETQPVPAVEQDGAPISSTRIRHAIQKGQFPEAGRMLGRPYALCSKVVQGHQIGRKLGFPTANLDAISLALPPNGVYAARAEFEGRSYRAVLNIGFRPTLSNPVPRLSVEAHLLDFSGDLYGKELEITFVQKLRDETKFPAPEALRTQIQADIRAAQQLLS